ncbi:MAG: DUF726 domain-containing protein [Candidatus Nitrosotenuis sp.]
MKQNKRIPRISTRGFYDLSSGRTLEKKPYELYPKKFFETLGYYPEFTIMVHGMRNSKSGALAKFRIAKKRLRQLGYKYPVVGFSYDSNIKGAQYKSHELETTKIGRLIARKNGKNLSHFIIIFKNRFPHTKINLVGHSLGTEVILHVLSHLAKKQKAIKQVCFFGSSIPINVVYTKKFNDTLKKTIIQKISNYYAPNDQVLKHAHESGIIKNPIGYRGSAGRIPSKLTDKKVTPKNHRFANYMSEISSFR